MARKRHLLRQFLALAVGAALLAAPAAAAEEAAPGGQEPVLAICTTGNLAGRVYRQDPLTGGAAEAGFLNAASAAAQLREETQALLLLDSGNAVDNGLIQDGGAAEAAAMRAIGYDALVPGLGEFRLGPGARDGFFDALTDPEGDGAPVRVLSGNCLTEDGQPAAEPYGIFTVELGGAQFRVGVLGLGAMEAPAALPQSFTEGLRFAHEDNTERSYVWEWTQFWQERLEAEHCDLVVVVCAAGRDTAADFAARTSGIDLVVGNGAPWAETLQNADGAPVACVSGGGSALTRTDVTLSGDGTLSVGGSSLLQLEEWGSDEALVRLLSPFREEAEALALEKIGVLSGDWSGEGDPRYVQSPTAELAARAMCRAAGADAALFPAEALRGVTAASLFREGEDAAALTLRSCAALLPGAEPIAAVELTGARLREWLDHCAGAYTVDETGSITGGDTADALYGLDYSLYLGAPEGERAAQLSLGGQPVEDGQVLRVAVPVERLSDPDFPECRVVWRSDLDGRFAGQAGAPAALLAAYVSAETEQGEAVLPVQAGTRALYPGSADGPLNRLELLTMLYELAGKPLPGASGSFIDVGDNPAAVWAAEAGVVSGNGQGMLLPTQAVSREQAAVMFCNYARFLGVEAPAEGPSAEELADGGDIAAWAAPAVEFCLRTGALPADGEGRFLPGGTLTRAEAASCLERLSAFLEGAQAG